MNINNAMSAILYIPSWNFSVTYIRGSNRCKIIYVIMPLASWSAADCAVGRNRPPGCACDGADKIVLL